MELARFASAPAPSEAFEHLCRILARSRAPAANHSTLAAPIWNAVLALSEEEGMAPALHEAVTAHCPEIATKTERAVLAISHELNRRRNVALRKALLELGETGASGGFQFAVLKGGAWLLEGEVDCAAWRLMSDLDVLVDQKQYGAVSGLFERMGYAPLDELERVEASFQAPYCRPGLPIIVEVHRHLGWRHHVLPPEVLLASSRPVASGLLLPAPWVRAFHAIVHWQIQDHGSSRGTLPLKELVEIARFLARADVEWARVASHAEAVGVTKACKFAVASAATLLQAPVPPEISLDLRAKRWVARSVALRASPLRTWLKTQMWRAGTLWRCEKVAYRCALRGNRPLMIAVVVCGARIVRLPLLAVRAVGIASRALRWVLMGRSPFMLPPARDRSHEGTSQQASVTAEVCYSFRSGAFRRERTYRIGPDTLSWSDGGKEHRIAYSDVDAVRLYRRFMRGETALAKKTIWRLHLYGHSGRRIVLSPLHHDRLGRWDDRSAPYTAFVNALFVRLRSANPNLKVVVRRHWTMRLRDAIRRAAMPIYGWTWQVLITLLGHGDPDRTARAAGRLMRAVGPWLRGHRVARANLTAAFPKKSDQEIGLILQGVWDNFGRVMAEYAFLNRLWDYDARAAAPKRIVIDSATAGRLTELRDKGSPVVCFGAHLANWELPAAMAPAFGIKSAMIYRPPDAGKVADQITKLRSQIMGRLIPARRGAALRMLKALRRGASVAMLVDEQFVGGIDVLFFGRQCRVNPTPAWLARQCECPIYGARAVRLADGHFQLELTEMLRPPRDQEGKIDVAATMQMITSIVEMWVREHPEQWIWMRRRWG
jgi:Kdo2-lipid IVA lauroyltransferase/acyltransferase